MDLIACVKYFVFIFFKNLFEFFPCHFQVVAHGPDGQYRCYKHQYVTNEIERIVIFVCADKQKEDGDHLGGGFEFADSGHCNAAAFAHLCHPFAQGGNGDFPADNNHGEDGVCSAKADEQEQGNGNHELVGNGVEECTEVGGLFPAAC